MTLKDIPPYLGITSEALARMIGVSKQAMHQYTTGKRGQSTSKVLQKVLDATQLHYEEIIFTDAFDHPHAGSPENPAYWINLAIEALYQAKDRGADVDSTIESLKEIGYDILQDFHYSDIEAP